MKSEFNISVRETSEGLFRVVASLEAQGVTSVKRFLTPYFTEQEAEQAAQHYREIVPQLAEHGLVKILDNQKTIGCYVVWVIRFIHYRLEMRTHPLTLEKAENTEQIIINMFNRKEQHNEPA